MATEIFGRHEGPAFISEKFYRSDSYISKPGEAHELPNKHPGWTTATRHNKHSDNGGTARKKNKPNSENPPSKVMVCYASTGHRVMMTREQFASLSWGWEIT